MPVFQNGPKWDRLGDLGGQFWVFEAARPFGTVKNVIWSNFFLKKTVFFWAPIGANCPQNGPKCDRLGSVGGQFWGFEASRPFLWDPKKCELEQKNF